MNDKVKKALKDLALGVVSAVVAFITTIITNGGF